MIASSPIAVELSRTLVARYGVSWPSFFAVAGVLALLWYSVTWLYVFYGNAAKSSALIWKSIRLWATGVLIILGIGGGAVRHVNHIWAEKAGELATAVEHNHMAVSRESEYFLMVSDTIVPPGHEKAVVFGKAISTPAVVRSFLFPVKQAVLADSVIRAVSENRMAFNTNSAL